MTGTFVFQALYTLCVLVDETISNRLSQFNSNQYVSASVTPSNVFQLQTKALISQFISSTTNDFLLSFNMIRKTTQSNALLSGQLTNYRFYFDESNYNVFTKSVRYGDCTCSSSATCINQYTVINYPNFTKMFPLPGLYTGCYIIESLLQSSLQCFYDQACVDNLKIYLGSPTFINVTALDILLSSQFLANSTIADVLEQLMVEEWKNSSMYENYYGECQPSRCSYTVTSKNSVIYIVTTLIGLIGETLVQESNVSILYKLKDYFLTFNIFPSVPPTTDEHQLRNQRISTRLFIIALIILFSILILYTSLINITETVNVKAPSIQEYEQLYDSYSQALTCECTQISINYEKFIQIQYTLHQICHSDFVTQEWTNYLATSYGNSVLNNSDFRVTSTFTFQAMNALCTLVNQTILNRLTEFYSNQYVSASVISSNIFQLQTNAFISQFISSTTDNFLLSLSMIRNTTQSNILLSGGLNNYGFSAENNNYLNLHPRWYGNCTCSTSATCISQSVIYSLSNGKLLFYVPGLYTGCYVIESLLQSSLQCFYNQTCINQLQSYFQVSSLMNVTALNASLSVQFLANSTVADVLEQLMVEEWNNSSMYENYYSECQPSYCSYTVTSKNSIIYIVTTLIGLVGGLITVLKFIVPYLVMLVRRKKEFPTAADTVMSINERVRALLKKTTHSFLNFNIFPSVAPTIDEHQLRNQRISTRLFIILLTISLSILVLYTSLVHITGTVNVKAPSIQEYEQLYNSYNQTLTCECTQISINYEKFIQIQYTLHQVCHSDFVTQKWINYLATSNGTYGKYTDDFRSSGTYVFQTISAFCTLVNQTILNRLTEFNSSQYVSAFVIPSSIFQVQTNAFISQFKSSTTIDFLLSLSMIRNITQSNALFSGRLTNYAPYITAGVIARYPAMYGNCTCSYSATCISQSPIYNLLNGKRLFYVPGLYTGCYVIESLLQSSLQCFYNQTCINQLQSYFQVSSLMNVTALNASLSVQFLANSTVADVLEQLMVEEWNNSSMYENYYNECQPSYCSYTVTSKNSIIYIVTTLIGLVGGLITVLKLMVPYLVEFIMFCIKKCKGRRTTITPLIQT
ncbi:unnamed protein product [Adineta steineri]|uniref:Uncharacterized protein n=1 Tax=Adineta steineri TaxID=433720 RepID=A0A819GDP5_9BILA|nr:unnamed protein product [Adineta steineri]CAF3878126.1 unnamed protein product [Adineta steineri]